MGTSEITSSCKYYTNINFNEKIMDQMPSKNVPIKCLLCKAVSWHECLCMIWKYNAMNHLLMEHIEVKNNQSSVLPIPPQMKMAMYISRDEEVKLGVELCQTLEVCERLLLPGINDVELAKIEEQEAEKKRGRSDIIVSKGQPGKKKRR